MKECEMLQERLAFERKANADEQVAYYESFEEFCAASGAHCDNHNSRLPCKKCSVELRILWEMSTKHVNHDWHKNVYSPDEIDDNGVHANC